MKKISYSFTKDQQNIINYLKEQVLNGKTYFKSKHIGLDLNLSSKTVGTNLLKISKKHKTLKILAYAEASATTWRVAYKHRVKEIT